MQNINEIRQHIRAIEQTRKITNAMHLVSSARMKKVMPQLDYNRMYFARVQNAMQEILAASDNDVTESHPYLADRGSSHITYIVVSGDKGMAGAYNENILNFAWDKMQGCQERHLITVGVTASMFFKSKGVIPDIEVMGASQDPSLVNARHLSRDLFNFYDMGLTDRVYVIYTAFFGTARYFPRIRQLLPIELSSYPPAPVRHEHEMIYHPSPKEVFDLLAPQYTIGILFGALVQAYASEHCSRMNAMQSATQNADEMLRKLKTQYNISRQASITQEITEIAGAAQALREDGEASDGV